METYKGTINEFVDWVTGQNTWTGEDVTEGLQVSGGSIRQLLQDRLKHPFVLKEDPANNKYRMFSSEEAYSMWLSNPSDNADLELFNFVRPSDYKLTFIGLNNSSRYVRFGDRENADTRIQFSWDIRNDEGLSNENLQITYTITNESTGTVNTFTRWYNAGEAVDFSIYQYLKAGRNSISISGIGTQNGARNSASFNIIMLELNVSSSFQFYKKYTNGTYITIPCTFTRNDVSGTARVHYVIDSGDNAQEWTTDVLSNSGVEINVDKVIMLDLQPGLHTLQIYAEGQYNDGTITVNTNLLYFTFVIASDDISTQKYICVGAQFDVCFHPINVFTLNATQYLQQTLQWGYYTEALQTDSKINVVWKLYRNEEDENPIVLSTMTANTQTKSSDLQFIPTVYSEYDQSGAPLTYLSAQFKDQELLRIPVQIVQNTDFSVYEVVPYDLKLSAYGKTNGSTEREEWKYGQVTTTFHNIQWNQNSGWYENSFRTANSDEYAIINYPLFENYHITAENGQEAQGRTIEIEFETEKVDENDDVLVCFGTPGYARIEITPTTATLYDNGDNEKIRTNYKANERIKLQFILNPVTGTSDKKSGLAFIVNNGILERAASAADGTYNNLGTIKIGGSNSGIRVYSIRIYDRAISYADAYANFLYDSEDKAQIYNRNNIVGQNGEISFDLCKNKIDTILISGDLSRILNQNALKDDSESEVTIERICPSDTSKNFKIVNAKIRKHGQSTLNYPVSSMKIWLNKSMSNAVPQFEITPQDPLPLNKNRYRMKNSSIPSNKFVLQANYADSSGVHNGGLERLIQNSWYNAKIDGKYLLRTLPQLFTSISSEDKDDYGLSTTWDDYFPNRAFPYELRVAPDSFPCVVFYKNVGEDTQTFLGQYVFMDDKKSDFLYGERSIYRVPEDPFCLTTTHAKDDSSDNVIWNNNNVLRIEVIESNNVYSSYMTTNGFTDVENVINETTGEIIDTRYKWEGAFEMIYPDPDDIAGDPAAGTDKFGTNSKFVRKAQPFIDWYNWVVSTRNNQAKFQAEAADHLDLYKLAAYYIFALRFGLVDSMERNAQIKTYDGVHFHYEPWDMDIALGNKNDGGIAYNPPIDRNTKLPGSMGTYAFSGRSANESNGVVVTSNWLWDALEAWPEWINVIVPKVADALYNAEGDGKLTYDNICKMFDNVYADAWCETIYNKSGDFKYIQSRDSNEWLKWLQGARLSHRHWWLSTSMDYYDAKWFCGDYKLHSIYITANVSVGDALAEEGEEGISGNSSSGKSITVVPNKSTYIVVQKDYNTIFTDRVTPQEPLVYTVPVMNTKNPFHIFGANYIESVDFSQIATGLDSVDFSGVYSEVLGSPLKSINIGTPIRTYENGYQMTVASLGGAIRGATGSFENLHDLNVRGQRNFTSIRNLIYEYDVTSLRNVRAMGSGMTSFYSSESGNTFDLLELPSDINVFSVNNTTWNTLEFWDCALDGSTATLTLCDSVVPSTLQTLVLNGTSCQNRNSIQLVRNWLRAIQAADGDFSNYTFRADNVNWSPATVGDAYLLTYEELSQLAQMQGSMSGYICLRAEKDENDHDVLLTTQQLTQMKEWFGDSVFDRNSSGLIIDHKTEYVQINVGGSVTTINDELYVREGDRISLSATRFSLSEDDVEEGIWTVSYASVNDVQQSYSGGITERRMRLIDASESADGKTYLQTQESQAGGNYDIKVWYTVGGQQPSTVIIHIIGVTYPATVPYKFDLRDANYIPRSTSDSITIYQDGTDLDLYLDFSNASYTATVYSVQHTITRGSDVFTYNTLTGSTVGSNWSDLQLEVDTVPVKNALRLSCFSGVPMDNTMYVYNVQSVIRFNSGRTLSTTHTINIMDDPAIVTSIYTDMFDTIDSRWTAKYGEPIGRNRIYRSDLQNLDGGLAFPATIENMYTDNRDSLFNYLPCITSLSFTGCSSLVREYGSQDLFVFDNLINLETLYLNGCTSITGEIDLSPCSNIDEVNVQNTNINVKFATGSPVSTVAWGTPTEITLNSPATLTPASVSVQDSSNINSLELVNIPSNSGFAMFGKIMGVQ